MHAGALIKYLSELPEGARIAVRHPGGGYTSTYLDVAHIKTAVIAEFEPSDGIGELILSEDGQETIVIDALNKPQKIFPSMRPLFFCHIPKTAGGALSRSLRSIFTMGRTLGVETSNPTFRMSDADLSKYDLVMGHIGIELAHRLSRHALTMAVFRDPVKIVLSVYNFFLANKVIEPGLKEFLLKPGNRWGIENISTWLLVHDYSQSARRDEPYRNWSDQQLKDKAFETLQKINIIGDAADLPELLSRVEIIYERKPSPLERVNEVNRTVETPSDEELEIIRDLTKIDLEVYKEALRIKDEVWERTRDLVIRQQPTNHFV